MKNPITFERYVTADNKYPERLNSKELTEEVKLNIHKLLVLLNNLLEELQVDSVVVSSGFRPSSVNTSIGGAKKSLHMTGQACDLSDVDGKLDKLVEEKDFLLKKYGLWQEDPKSTVSWVHLDMNDRGKRTKNQFKP